MNKEVEQRLIDIVDELYNIAMENGLRISVCAGQRYNADYSVKRIDVYSSIDGNALIETFQSFDMEVVEDAD